MAKVYAKDIHDKETVKAIFLVARKSLTTAKNGKPFLAVVLRDKSGDLDARVWEHLEEMDPLFARGDFVEVDGSSTLFQGRPQLKIDAIHKVDPLTLDLSDFNPPPRPDPGERHLGPIGEIVEHVHDPRVKALLKGFLDDPAFVAEFKRAPAAKTIHHGYPGGLAEHTLSVMRLAQRVSDQYPMADRDLLIAGAFLHDVGKIKELTWERTTEYTDEGRLVGHLVIAAEWIHERAAKIEGFTPALEAHLKHLVLSHHGTLEFGSPRLPQTLEAMLLHHIDELDSRVASWLELMKKDGSESWTDFSRLYDRHLYKGASPTVSAKSPVERRHRKERERGPRRERIEMPSATPGTTPDATATPGAEKPEAAARSERPPRPERSGGDGHPPRDRDRDRGERRDRGPKKAEPKLTFKPFAALVAAAPEPGAEPESAEAAPSAATGSAPPEPDQAAKRDSAPAPEAQEAATEVVAKPEEPSNGG